MATIKFPNVNLPRIQTKNVIFEDWTHGMDTSVEGDNRDPRSSNLIRNLTNRYRGKLVMPNTSATYASDNGARVFYAQKFIFINENDTEYILCLINDSTAHKYTLEISEVDSGSFSWTELYELVDSTDYQDDPPVTVDYLDWTVSTVDGKPVVYVTYERSDGDGGTLVISYDEQEDALPYIKATFLIDDDEEPLEFIKAAGTVWSGDAPYGTYFGEDGTGLTPDLTGQVAVGDIVAIGFCTNDNYFSTGVEAGYVSLARVIYVDTGGTPEREYIEVDKCPFPGHSKVTYSYRIAKLSLEYADTAYTTGWHCRTMETLQPLKLGMLVGGYRSAGYSGVQNPVLLTDDLNGTALTEGYGDNDHVVYATSYQYAGGQHGPLREGMVPIQDIEENSYVHIGLEVRIDDTIASDWLMYHAHNGSYAQDYISGLNLWRRKAGEEEFGLLATIPRLGWRHNASIEDFYHDGAMALFLGVASSMYTFINIRKHEHTETGTPNQMWYDLGFTEHFVDNGDPLGETYRTVAGIEPEDAQNVPFGRSITSLGPRIFIGNAHFPTTSTVNEEHVLDDEVVYSVSDCGCMYALDNTLGYRAGSADYIVAIKMSGTNLFIFRNTSIGVISVAGESEFSWTPRGDFPYGLVAPHLVCNTPHGPAWFSHDGIYMFQNDGPENIARTIKDEYLAGVADTSDCAIAYAPLYDRLYVVLDDVPYFFGFDKVEAGWKRGCDTYYPAMGNYEGRFVGLNATNVNLVYIESNAVELKSSALPTWRSGQLTLGSCGEEIKLKRAYVWYSYMRQYTTGIDPVVDLVWYIDGVEQDRQHLYLGTGATDKDDGAGGQYVNLQRIYLNGRGRRVEFRIEFLNYSAFNWVKEFELRKVEIIYKTTRMK